MSPDEKEERAGVTVKGRGPLAAVILIGLILRIVLALGSEVVLRSDSLEYHEYAAHLVTDHRYYIVYHGPQRGWAGATLLSHRPPGYPFFLAAIYSVFGPNARWGFVFQALLDSFTIYLVYLLALRWLGERAALAAALIYALNPVRVAILMTEVLFVPLFLAPLLLLVDGKALKSTAWSAAAGLIFGIGILVRPFLVIFSPLVALYYLIKVGWRDAARLVAVWGVVSIAVITPWLIREYRVHGRFIWMATNGGRTFHQGNYIPVDATSIIVSGRLQGLDEVEIDEKFYQVSWDYLRKHPGFAVRMMFRRERNLWSLEMTGDIKNLLIEPLYKSPSPWKRTLGVAVYMLFILSRAVVALGFLGGVLCLGRARRLAVLYIVPAWISLLHFLAFQGSARYLVPVYPIFCVFIAMIPDAVRGLWPGRSGYDDG